MEKKDTPKIATDRTATESQSNIELFEERLNVEKKKIETGKVRISKRVLEEEVPVDLSVFNEEIEIERKKIGEVVDKPGPAVRREGDSTIFSMYKEVYVKQVILEEEVWISKRRISRPFKGKKNLKKEVLHIERTPNNSLDKE